MKKVLLLVSFFMILNHSHAQLDTVSYLDLSVGVSLGELVSISLPSFTLFGNKRVGRNQYVDVQIGSTIQFAINPRFDKINGQKLNLAYRYQIERGIFRRSSPFIGLSLDYAHLKGEGRTTYSRANGAFFQRFPFSTSNNRYSANLVAGVIYYIDDIFTFEIGAKLGVGLSHSKIKSTTPPDAIITDPNSYYIATSKYENLGRENSIFPNIRVTFRVGYIIKWKDN